ncbi:MAG: glycosyltransferase family 2 protein [Francisellaceae bacterium]
MSLGVVIITKDEEKNIARCINSVIWADEIIVVDSGSTDKTVEIAKGLGAKVIIRGWPGDGPQKYFGISQLTTDWCLVLDADEEVTSELAESIKNTLKSPQNTCYKIHRRSFFLGKIMKHGDWGRDWIVRLFDRTHHHWTQDIVHARLDVNKKNATKLSGTLLHHSQDDIKLSLQKMNDYSNGTSQLLFEKGKRTNLFSAIMHKYWTFFRSFIMRAGFLDGSRGYLIAKLSSYGAYFKYIKLWERHMQKKRKGN